MASPDTHSDARTLALAVLERVAGGGYADRTLDAELRRHPQLDPRDRALATELVYGVLRQQGRLDFALRRFCKQPLEKLPEVVVRVNIAMILATFLTASTNSVLKTLILLAQQQPKSSKTSRRPSRTCHRMLSMTRFGLIQVPALHLMCLPMILTRKATPSSSRVIHNPNMVN